MAAGLGVRVRQRADLAGIQRPDVLVHQRWRRPEHDRVYRAQVHDIAHGRGGAAVPGDRLAHHRIGDVVFTEAAVFLGDRQCQEAMLAEQFEISARELELVVGPLGIVAHFSLAQINQLGAQFLVPLGQHEVRVPFIAESPERLRSPHLLLAHRWTPLLRMYPSEWTMFTCTTHCREYPLPLRRGKGIGGVGSYDRPTISPSSSRSILAAAGDADRPGMVRMSPQMGYTKPAPA